MHIAHRKHIVSRTGYRAFKSAGRRNPPQTARKLLKPLKPYALPVCALPSIANAVFYAPRRRLEAETRGSRAGLGSQVRLTALMHDLCRE